MKISVYLAVVALIAGASTSVRGAAPGPAPAPGKGPASPPAGPVDRAVALRAGDGLDLSSFLAARPGEGTDPGQALLGLRARSALPRAPGGAELEYAVAVPDGGDATTMADPDRQFLRLDLDSRFHGVDYGLQLFSVGADYVRSDAGRDHLEARGLPGTGRGAELSAAWYVEGIRVQPRVRRVVREGDEGLRLDEAQGLAVERPIGDALDLEAGIEAVRDRPLGTRGEPGADTRRDARARLRLAGERWNVFWKGSSGRRSDGDRPAPERSATHEVGLRLDLPGGLAVAPRFRRAARAAAGADPIRLATGRVGVSATVPFLQDLDLALEYRDRQAPGADATGMGAVLELRRPLVLTGRQPDGFLMDLALSWRETEGAGRPLWDDGLAFRFSLEFRPAVLR